MQTGLDDLIIVASRCCKAQRKGRSLDSQHGIPLCVTWLHKESNLDFTQGPTPCSLTSHMRNLCPIRGTQCYFWLFKGDSHWAVSVTTQDNKVPEPGAPAASLSYRTCPLMGFGVCKSSLYGWYATDRSQLGWLLGLWLGHHTGVHD